LETTDLLALPIYKELNGRIGKEIRVENPKFEKAELRVRTGATERIIGVPLDENLRKARVQGNRMPLERTPITEVKSGGTEAESAIRNTGAVKRPPRSVSSPSDNIEEVKQAPRSKRNPINDFPPRSTGENSEENPNEGASVYRPRENNRERQAPLTEEPPQRPQRRERTTQPPPENEAEPSRPEPPLRREKLRPEPTVRESKPPEPEPLPPVVNKSKKVKDPQ